MPYLLDGMNVLHRVERLAEKLDADGPDAAIEALAGEIVRAWPEAAEKVTIVVDGGGGKFGRRKRASGIEVRMTAEGESGDEVMRSMVEGRPGYYVIVTDDRRLAASVGKKAVKAMSVKGFFEGVAGKRKKPSGEGGKNSVPDADDVEFWMKIFGE